MEKWYKTAFKRINSDLHIEDYDSIFLSKYDAEAYIGEILKTGAKSLWIWLQSHIGYCNYPTESGYAHKNFQGIGKFLELCDKNDLDAIAYYSLTYNNWVYDAHPSWRMVDANGVGSRELSNGHAVNFHGPRYGNVCMNNEEYREFTVSQIKEMVNVGVLKGFFFDMTFWSMICYCDSCKDRWQKEVGGEMPKIVDWNDPVWRKFQAKREEWVVDFENFVTDETRKINPDLTVQHNNAMLFGDWESAVTEACADGVDFICGDLYGGYFQQSFACKAYSAISPNAPIEYMTSICHPDLREHTTLNTEEMLLAHAYLCAAHHTAFLIIDALNLDGTSVAGVRDREKAVFEKYSEYEKYFKGELVYDAAVYFSGKSKFNPEANGHEAVALSLVSSNWSNKNPHVDAVIGASKKLKEAHIPYNVLTCKNFDLIEKAKILIMPEVFALDDEETEKIKDYVERGGNLLISGRTSPKMVEELTGFKFEGESKENMTYMNLTGEAKKSLGFDFDKIVAVKKRQVLMKNFGNCEVLATLTLPHTDPTDGTVFASIHSNPPSPCRKTNYVSIAQTNFGKGKVIWTAAALEDIENYLHAELFTSLVKRLIGSDLEFSSNAPKEIELVKFEDAENDCIYVSFVNIQESFPILPIYNFESRIKMNGRSVEKVLSLPSEKEVPFRIDGDYVVVSTEYIKQFEMIKIIYNA